MRLYFLPTVSHGDIFSTEDPFSRITPTWVKLTNKTNQYCSVIKMCPFPACLTGDTYPLPCSCMAWSFIVLGAKSQIGWCHPQSILETGYIALAAPSEDSQPWWWEQDVKQMEKKNGSIVNTEEQDHTKSWDGYFQSLVTGWFYKFHIIDSRGNM